MYEKQNFYAGQKLMASHLEAMEEGIIEALNKEIVSSWNNLTDRPFYEKTEVVTEEMTIEWDGVVGDRVTVSAGSGMMVHLSDVVLNDKNDAIGATCTLYDATKGEVEVTVTENDISTFTTEQGEVVNVGVLLWFVPKDGTTLDMNGNVVTFPKKGMYTIYIPNFGYAVGYTGILTADKSELKKLDPKYLPEHTHSWNDLEDKPFYDNSIKYVEWDGSTDGKYTIDLDGMRICHVSDVVISDPNELIGARVTILNEAGNAVVDDVCQLSGSLAVRVLDDTGLIGIGANLFMCIPEDNYQSDFLDSHIIEKSGIYAVLNMFEAMGATEVKIVAGDIKQLDEKFIPDTIARVTDVDEQINSLGTAAHANVEDFLATYCDNNGFDTHKYTLNWGVSDSLESSGLTLHRVGYEGNAETGFQPGMIGIMRDGNKYSLTITPDSLLYRKNKGSWSTINLPDNKSGTMALTSDIDEKIGALSAEVLAEARYEFLRKYGEGAYSSVFWANPHNTPFDALVIGVPELPEYDYEAPHVAISDSSVYVAQSKDIYTAYTMGGIVLNGEYIELPEAAGTLALTSDVATAKQEAIDAATILTSPNGTKYRLTVSDDGTLTAAPITTE